VLIEERAHIDNFGCKLQKVFCGVNARL
jgi:hypothetical protein